MVSDINNEASPVEILPGNEGERRVLEILAEEALVRPAAVLEIIGSYRIEGSGSSLKDK